MADNFKNAAPRMIFAGMQDVSGRAVPVVALQVPTHCPFAFVRSRWGLEVDQLVVGDQWLNLYGDDVFEERSPYFTHANKFADAINQSGNKQLAIRIVPKDAPPPAGMRHCIEYVIDDIVQYERNANGTYKLGANGQKVETGQKLRGVRLRHFFETINNPEDGTIVGLGKANPRAGEMISEATGEASTILPIQEHRRPCRGAQGNLGGIRLFAPTINSSGGTRDDLIESERAFLYRIQFLEKADLRSSASVKATINGEQSILFSYRDDFLDRRTKVEYGINQRLKQSYNAVGQNGGPDTLGVFKDFHVYEDNLQELLGLIQKTEAPHETVGASDLEDKTALAADLHLVNFLSATSWTGVPYYTAVVEGPLNGGTLFTESSIHYAQGGGDGTLTDESFDQGVREFINSIPDNELRLWDPYRVPASIVYDSGFSVDTKLELLSLLGVRDDIAVMLQTQVAGTPLNSEEEDYSIGVALKNRALAFPESVLHGTESLRCQIMSGAGTRVDSKLRYPQSLNLKVAEDFSAYMGAASGVWDNTKAPDEPENNGVQNYVETNFRSKNDTVVDNFWNAGIVWAQYRDRGEIFVPAYQSVYPDDTSVLNSTLNMLIGIDVIKECRYVWTLLTGRTRLTKDQLLKRGNQLLQARLQNKYDGRVRFVIEFFLTPVDETLGYSWSANVRMFMNNMPTVGQFSVIAHRMDELVTFDTTAAA